MSGKNIMIKDEVHKEIKWLAIDEDMKIYELIEKILREYIEKGEIKHKLSGRNRDIQQL